MSAPTTLAITTGLKAPTEKEPSTSSRAKKAPAKGAPKAPAIPAAAPQPTRIFRCRASKRKSRPSVEPSAEPSTATGPSLPAEPPAPSVTAAATVRPATGRSGTSPPRLATASCTSGTFCPSSSRSRLTTSHAAQRPTAVSSGR